MTVGNASWFELLARMAAAARLPSAAGRMRIREPDRSGQVQETELDFAYQAPDRWRVESRHGALHVSDGHRSVAWRKGRPKVRPPGPALLDYPHPAMLLQPPWGDPASMDPADAAARPVAQPRPVELLGRPAHEVTLPPAAHASSGLTLVIDEQTGVLLRAVDESGDWLLELVELQTDLELPDHLFSHDDEAAPRTVAGAPPAGPRPRPPSGRAGTAPAVIPVPRYWPGGLPTHHWEIDADTGAFLAWLQVGSGRPGDPATATLLRWPAEQECPWRKAFATAPGEDASPAWHEIRRGPHRWALVLYGGDLPPHEVQAVFDSLP